MKTLDTPKTHKKKFSVAKSQQTGLQKNGAFNRPVDSDQKIAAREKLRELQSKNKK